MISSMSKYREWILELNLSRKQVRVEGLGLRYQGLEFKV
jgi:hypothetical protein